MNITIDLNTILNGLILLGMVAVFRNHSSTSNRLTRIETQIELFLRACRRVGKVLPEDDIQVD